MQDFKKLELKDIQVFNKYLKEYNFATYEYSFTTLYLWRNFCQIYYKVIDDVLILIKSDSEMGTYFMEPIGLKDCNIKSLVNYLNKIKSENNINFLFRDIEEDFLEKLIKVYDSKIIYHEDLSNFDYIYNSQDLIELKGKKYHSKKNHYNTFVNTYNYTVVKVETEDVICQCIQFAKEWYKQKDEKTNQLLCEVSGIEDILKNKDILGIDAIAVYVDNKIVGLSIGEKINDNMAIIHIEKCDNNYKGIYAFINKTFIEMFYSDVKYINREEDLGVEGLRKAKMSYHPIKLEKKYIVNIL